MRSLSILSCVAIVSAAASFAEGGLELLETKQNHTVKLLGGTWAVDVELMARFMGDHGAKELAQAAEAGFVLALTFELDASVLGNVPPALATSLREAGARVYACGSMTEAAGGEENSSSFLLIEQHGVSWIVSFSAEGEQGRQRLLLVPGREAEGDLLLLGDARSTRGEETGRFKFMPWKRAPKK